MIMKKTTYCSPVDSCKTCKFLIVNDSNEYHCLKNPDKEYNLSKNRIFGICKYWENKNRKD